jgi:hypothetical protein
LVYCVTKNLATLCETLREQKNHFFLKNPPNLLLAGNEG